MMYYYYSPPPNHLYKLQATVYVCTYTSLLTPRADDVSTVCTTALLLGEGRVCGFVRSVMVSLHYA